MQSDGGQEVIEALKTGDIFSREVKQFKKGLHCKVYLLQNIWTSSKLGHAFQIVSIF